MSNFVFPIILISKNQNLGKIFKGVGIYITENEHDIASIAKGYNPNYRQYKVKKRQIENARYAAISLFPGCTDDEKQIYELLTLDIEVHGASRDLAYFLTLINQSQDKAPYLKEMKKDIWCTGAIRENRNGFYLKPVTDNEFNLKLNAFLGKKFNTNHDGLFIVPEANIDPEHRKACKSKNVNVYSLDDFYRGKAQLDPFKKSVLKVNMGSSQLIDLVNFLFADEPLKSDNSNVKIHLSKIQEDGLFWTPFIVKGKDVELKKGIVSTIEHPNNCSMSWFSGETTAILGSGELNGEPVKSETVGQWKVKVGKKYQKKHSSGYLFIGCLRFFGGLHSNQYGKNVKILINKKYIDGFRLMVKPQEHTDYFHRIPQPKLPDIWPLSACQTVYAWPIQESALVANENQIVSVIIDENVSWDIDYVAIICK